MSIGSSQAGISEHNTDARDSVTTEAVIAVPGETVYHATTPEGGSARE